MKMKVGMMFLYTSCFFFKASAQVEKYQNISGDYYDWTKTGKPESAYAYPYQKMLVMHAMLATPDEKGNCNVRYTFEDVLSQVKQVDAITRGIPKIIYLVGWQYSGHDDLYPAWHHVNDALKRPADSTGRQSLIWLYHEAQKYNTIISVHVNMTDAYKNSPLWDIYLKEEIISRLENGEPMKTGEWNNRDAFQVCYKQEWEKGYATKRINELIELLPFLKEAKTIYLDAFFSRRNPYLNISEQEEETYQRRIIRYFKRLGMDVVQESYLRLRDGKDHFNGLSPWFLWFDQNEEGFMRTPATIATGGGPFLYCKQFPALWTEQMQLGFLFGMSTRGEDCFVDIEDNFRPVADWQKKFRYQFYTGTLPYVYLNQYRRESISGKGLQRVVTYSDDLAVSLKDSLITHHGRIIRSKNDVFMPAIWKKEREIIAYSENGYTNMQWTLPPEWSDVKNVRLYRIENNGRKLLKKASVINGSLKLSLQKGEAISIVPVQGG